MTTCFPACCNIDICLKKPSSNGLNAWRLDCVAQLSSRFYDRGLLFEAGQYIGTIPTMQSNIPSSDSRFGMKSAIHHGVLACQLMIDGWPVTQ